MNLLTYFVQLDPRLQEFIGLGITLVVSYLLLQLAQLVPALADYLGQYKTGIVVWLTSIAVQLIQAKLNQIPANWDEVVYLVMKLIVEVVVVLLGFAVLRHYRVKGHQALQ